MLGEAADKRMSRSNKLFGSSTSHASKQCAVLWRVMEHTSALLSAFLSRLSRNTADFLGHRA
jgi:hypothetical protein